MSHSFDLSDLLRSIPSEISILSYSSIYISYKQSSKKNLRIVFAVFFKNIPDNNCQYTEL